MAALIVWLRNSTVLIFILFTQASDGQIITTVAGGSAGDGYIATKASMRPNGIATDISGNLFIADGQYRIRKIDAFGIITTIGGDGNIGYTGDGAPATNAEFNGPESIACDKKGSLFITDVNCKCIRMIDTFGIVNTIAGNGMTYGGDGGSATAAGIDLPRGIALDNIGNIYFSDQTAHRVRKIDLTGIISTIAGNGSPGYSGDGTAASTASLNHPSGLAIDGLGNLFIADVMNNCIRKINASGLISTVSFPAQWDPKLGIHVT